MSLDESEEEQKIDFDPLEISVCQWIPLDEWANSPEKHPIPLTLQFARTAVAVLDGREQLLDPHRIVVQSEKLTIPPWEIMMYRKKLDDEK
jgi:hypothetical protein